MNLTMLIIFLSVGAACSVTNREKIEEKEKIALELAKSQYTTIVFKEGKSTLNPIQKKALEKFAIESKRSRNPIGSFKILSWADKEYPPELKENKATTEDILLAAERNRNIREYLENELKIENEIDSFNMAKRPSALARITKNEDFKIKQVLEEADPSSARLPDGSLSYTKASKSIVMINFLINAEI